MTRDLLRGSASALATLVVVAFAAGSTPSAAVTAIAWALVLAAFVAPIWHARRRDPDLRGPRAASLLGARAPALVSAAQTAREFEEAPPEGSSGALVAAQRASVLEAITAHPAPLVIPRSAFFTREHRALALLIVVLALVLVRHASVGAGLFALSHPNAHTIEGERVAVFVHVDRVRVIPPAYLESEPTELGATTQVTAPRGATIELELRSLVPDVSSIELRFSDARTLPVTLDGSGRGTLRLLASRAGTARFVAERDGAPLLDAASLVLDVTPDRAPTVRLSEPSEDRVVEPYDMIVAIADAEDDHRLDHLDIVVTTMDGAETRHSFAPSELLPSAASGMLPLRLADLGAEPGDTIWIHAEARDLDDVEGPNVSRSERRALRLRADADRAAEALSNLEALRELALELLADRIEQPVPEAAEDAQARFASLSSRTRVLLDGLTRVTNGALEGTVRSSDRGVYGAVRQQLAHALDDERRLHGPLARLATRVAADGRATSRLEEAVLTLSALLARARTDDAAAITRELDLLRRQMASLLAELRRARTPEAMQELTRMLARARRRLAELRARLAGMGEGGPREFQNVGEQDLEETEQALSRLGEALEGDDLDAAARALTGLEQEIDSIARALGQEQESVTEERFGARERAIADVIDRLMSLEAEQRELADRTRATQRRAVERAIEADAERARDAAEALAADAARAHAALGDPPRGIPSSERDAWSEARDRLRDVEAALSSGDLGEARRMAQEAGGVLSSLERQLALDAMMFPGHEGSTRRTARTAEEAARGAAALERAIERAIPNLEAHLDGEDRGQITGDVRRQASAREATGQLAERLEGLPMGSGGADLAGGLREVRASMEAAERQLSALDAPEAARSQAQAAERLTELRRQLEQDQQGGEGGGSGADSNLSRESVVIPDANAFETPMEQRRRVLDAMGDRAPRGYEDAVRRYYEGLLR